MKASNHSRLIGLFVVLFALTFGTGARAGGDCGGQDCKKTTLAMAYISNVSGDIEWKSKRHTTDVTAQRIDWALLNVPSLEQAWTREWGPVIDFQQVKCRLAFGGSIAAPEHPIPANTMFVAKNGSDYVVAIAGTNPESRYDWCKEDLAFNPTPWPTHQWPPKKIGHVTKATFAGLNILKGMADPEEKDLLAYLGSLPADGSAKIYVTGHSLGGALAPALALWLKEKNSNLNLKIYAYAGATPGDQTFKDYLDPLFPEDNMVIVNNTRDVVPQAWHHDLFSRVASLYSEADIKVCGGKLDCRGAEILHYLALGVSGKNYQTLGTSSPQPHPQQQPITGKLLSKTDLGVGPDKCSNLLGKCKCSKPLCTKLDTPVSVYFGAEMLYQHIDAYPNQLGLPGLNNLLCQCRQKFDPAVKKDCKS